MAGELVQAMARGIVLHNKTDYAPIILQPERGYRQSFKLLWPFYPLGGAGGGAEKEQGGAEKGPLLLPDQRLMVGSGLWVAGCGGLKDAPQCAPHP